MMPSRQWQIFQDIKQLLKQQINSIEHSWVRLPLLEDYHQLRYSLLVPVLLDFPQLTQPRASVLL